MSGGAMVTEPCPPRPNDGDFSFRRCKIEPLRATQRRRSPDDTSRDRHRASTGGWLKAKAREQPNSHPSP